MIFAKKGMELKIWEYLGYYYGTTQHTVHSPKNEFDEITMYWDGTAFVSGFDKRKVYVDKEGCLDAIKDYAKKHTVVGIFKI